MNRIVLFATGTGFIPALKTYRGCMGRTVPGVEFVNGAYANNPFFVFSWLLHRYNPTSQARILSTFKMAGDQDFLLSWPDFEHHNPTEFGHYCNLVQTYRMHPNVFLTNKWGPRDLQGLKDVVSPVLPALKKANVPRVCVGWELDSFLNPGSVKVSPPDPGVLQPFINWLVPLVQPADLYVHFTGGKGAWQQDGLLFADFWNINQHKLRGVFHQKITDQNDADYQMGEGGLHDILLHFNGGSGCTPDSGDGTPFDLHAFEVNLELCSAGVITEEEMHRRASVGLATPSTVGPTGEVKVMGSGCGQTS